MRQKTLRDFHTLEDSHPITPDRQRAALAPGAPEPPAMPAYSVITPAGAAGIEAIELRLTALLFESGGPKRGR